MFLLEPGSHFFFLIETLLYGEHRKEWELLRHLPFMLLVITFGEGNYMLYL